MLNSSSSEENFQNLIYYKKVKTDIHYRRTSFLSEQFPYCDRCRYPILGDHVPLEGKLFLHPRCFKCDYCTRPLSTSANLGSHNVILCDACFSRISPESDQTNQCYPNESFNSTPQYTQPILTSYHQQPIQLSQPIRTNILQYTTTMPPPPLAWPSRPFHCPSVDDNHDNKNMRKKRTFFTPQQKFLLKEAFQQDPYPTFHVISAIADKIGISWERIRIWFQNERGRQNVRKTKKRAMRAVELA
ncbi:hypothetical protein ACOME3_005414 [Neoechinorhynchus agilis]